MFAVWMAALSRCAMASVCPSDAEIKAALYARADDVAGALANEEYARNPKEIVFFHPAPVKHLRRVHCGEPVAQEPLTIDCSFTVTYASSVMFQVARLTLVNGKWTIVDSRAVRRRTAQ